MRRLGNHKTTIEKSPLHFNFITIPPHKNKTISLCFLFYIKPTFISLLLLFSSPPSLHSSSSSHNTIHINYSHHILPQSSKGITIFHYQPRSPYRSSINILQNHSSLYHSSITNHAPINYIISSQIEPFKPKHHNLFLHNQP